MRLEDRAVRERVARMEALLDEIESLPDPKTRALAIETVQGLLELYGEGLARVMAHVTAAAAAGGGESAAAAEEMPADAITRAFIDDELVSHLLLLHGLHPVDAAARVEQALEEARPYLASHGGDVELVGIEEGVAHLRLRGSCSGCPSSAQTLTQAVEQAIRKAAPDLAGIEAEYDPAATASAAPAGFIPAAALLHRVERRGRVHG